MHGLTISVRGAGTRHVASSVSRTSIKAGSKLYGRRICCVQSKGAAEDPSIEASVLREHEEAREFGASGVPAIRRADNDAVIVGAHPEELYRRWIDRSLERGEGLVTI